MNKQGFGPYLLICALLICDIATHCVHARPIRGGIPIDTRTHRLEIVNSAGKVTAKIDNDTDGTPEMVMYDQKGKERYLLTANDKYAEISFYNSNGERQLALGASDESFVAAYTHTHPNIVLYSEPDGEAGLGVLDSSGSERASIAYHPDGNYARVAVKDSEKSAEMNCDQDAAVVSADDQKVNRRSMLIYMPAVDTAMFVVNDKEKKPTWSAPVPPPPHPLDKQPN